MLDRRMHSPLATRADKFLATPIVSDENPRTAREYRAEVYNHTMKAIVGYITSILAATKSEILKENLNPLLALLQE